MSQTTANKEASDFFLVMALTSQNGVPYPSSRPTTQPYRPSLYIFFPSQPTNLDS